MHHPFRIVSRLEIDKNHACFLNPKRIELLEQIRLQGSILAASKQIRMSYQQAWTIVKEINAESPLPVVIRQRGGEGGGGTLVTPFGLKLMERFNTLETRYKQYILELDEDLQKLCTF